MSHFANYYNCEVPFWMELTFRTAYGAELTLHFIRSEMTIGDIKRRLGAAISVDPDIITLYYKTFVLNDQMEMMHLNIVDYIYVRIKKLQLRKVLHPDKVRKRNPPEIVECTKSPPRTIPGVSINDLSPRLQENKIQTLINMGFTDYQAITSLEQTNGDIERAIARVFDGGIPPNPPKEAKNVTKNGPSDQTEELNNIMGQLTQNERELCSKLQSEGYELSLAAQMVLIANGDENEVRSLLQN